MVNVALLVVAGATFLNSISVILLAVYARKKEKEIRKLKLEQDKMWKSTTENIWVSDQSRDKQIENLQKDLKDMYMERSVVRNISVPKKYFMTRTFNEKRGKKKELADYSIPKWTQHGRYNKFPNSESELVEFLKEVQRESK